MKEIRNKYLGKWKAWTKKEPSQGRFQEIFSYIALFCRDNHLVNFCNPLNKGFPFSSQGFDIDCA